MSAPTAGLAQRFLALRSRRARSRPAARGAGRPKEEAGGRSRRGGGGRGVGDPEAPVPGNLGGPGAAPGGSPRHNLPRTHRPHPALWKKEPAHCFPLGCSSASAGPPAPAAPLDSASPALPPSACSARRPPRSAPAGVSLSPGCARRAGKAGASRCREAVASSVFFAEASQGAADPEGPACRNPHSPFVLPSGDGAEAPLEAAFPGLCLCGFGGSARRVGPAVRPGRETLHPASGPAEAWGPEGMGKRSPFFPVPAILRFKFSLGASVANHAALGARLVAGSGDERLGGPRTSSPEYRGSARRDPHLNFQGLEPRARVNSPNSPEAQEIRGTGAGS